MMDQSPGPLWSVRALTNATGKPNLNDRFLFRRPRVENWRWSMSGTFFGKAVVWSCLGISCGLWAQPAKLASGRADQLETVATFNGSMPTGVAVAHNGRIFV